MGGLECCLLLGEVRREVATDEGPNLGVLRAPLGLERMHLGACFAVECTFEDSSIAMFDFKQASAWTRSCTR